MIAQWFVVASPEYDWPAYTTVTSIEPPEPQREFIYVRARNRRQAKVLAVRAMRRQGRARWCYSDQNPFGGKWQIVPIAHADRHPPDGDGCVPVEDA